MFQVHEMKCMLHVDINRSDVSKCILNVLNWSKCIVHNSYLIKFYYTLLLPNCQILSLRVCQMGLRFIFKITLK